MTTIALQDVLIPHAELIKDIDAARSVGIEPIRFGLIPFTDVISTDDEADKLRPAVMFGAVKIIKLWEQRKTPEHWTIFTNNCFDQRIWGPALGERALNPWATIGLASLREVLDIRQRRPVFVKPTNDLKAFPGMVVPEGATIAEALAERTQDSGLVDTQPIIIAPTVEIAHECRCWVVDSRVIATSRYKTGARATPEPTTATEHANLVEWVEAMFIPTFEPEYAYCVDVAMLPNGSWRVVEYNCVNCSGRYAADRAKIFTALIAAV